MNAATETELRPPRGQTLGDLLRGVAETTPDRAYCTVSGRAYTFAELNTAANALAAGLYARGVRADDRVALLMPNRAEMVESIFALAKLGAIQVPLNVHLKGEFLRHQLHQSQASAIVFDADGAAALGQVVDGLEDLRLCVPVDSAVDGQRLNDRTEQVAFAELAAAGGEPPIVAGDLGAPMTIMYTSGTTGLPKGCVLSHGYYQRAAGSVGAGLELTENDVLFTTLPLFHAAAQFGALVNGLLYGIPVVIDPIFSARGFMARAAEVGATVSFGIGAMGMALLSTPPSSADRAHRLRAMFIAPLPADAQAAFLERFGIDPWAEAYGQTECVPMTCTPLSGDRDRESCGRAAEDLELALLDDEDLPVADGEVGEFAIRPKHRFVMFDGYWNAPEATLPAFRNLWYHTGDYGRRLPSGAFAFVDRKKDAMRRRGENVSSMEVEAAIVRHPKIAEVAVHAVPSPATEDDIKACIVLIEGAATTPEELFAFFRDHLPFYAMPRYVELLDELPRNAVARVMKYRLRARPIDDNVWDFDALGLRLEASERRSIQGR